MEQVDNVPVFGRALREGLVEPGRVLEVSRAVAVDVVVQANRLFEVVADDHAGALGRGPAREEHDAHAGAGKRCLKEAGWGGELHGSAAIGRACPGFASGSLFISAEVVGFVVFGVFDLVHLHLG